MGRGLIHFIESLFTVFWVIVHCVNAPITKTPTHIFRANVLFTDFAF